ncbi:hypothetical protein D046_2719A, partial [Vibrio parahaemolyticus V-223/04]
MCGIWLLPIADGIGNGSFFALAIPSKSTR